MRVHDSDEVKIARVRTSTLRGYIQTIYIHTTIAEKFKPIVHFEDKHHVGLFDIKKTMAIMDKVGLDTAFDAKLLSGTFIGVKRG